MKQTPMQMSIEHKGASIQVNTHRTEIWKTAACKQYYDGPMDQLCISSIHPRPNGTPPKE